MSLLVVLHDLNGVRPVTWKLGSLAEAEREEAEDNRLLYVAATRAKEKLLINGHVKRLKDGNLSLGGWLGRLGEVIGLDNIQLAGAPLGMRALPDLAAPLQIPEMRLLDEKIIAREADPPQRV